MKLKKNFIGTADQKVLTLSSEAPRKFATNSATNFFQAQKDY